MLAWALSATVVGVDAREVRVEVFVSGGLPSFTVVGLPGAAVQESRERVRAALKHLGAAMPPSRITVNLAPADVRKEGPAFDLPIALALLAAERRLPALALQRLLSFGELALDGTLRPVRGAINIGLLAAERGHATVLCPPENAAEVAVVAGLQVLAPRSLAEAADHLRGRVTLARCAPGPPAPAPAGPDLADVRGQAGGRRALEIAAAGGHNLLLTGPPGAGKTMLARRLPGLLPPLPESHAIEVTRIHSSAGLLHGHGLLRHPPFRAPHHTSSQAGVVGGGSPPRPGEASLAHRGVLFLDELPEFGRRTLEALRQPLEDGRVTLSRVGGTVTFPARFLLVGARNPCPCGFDGDPAEPCSCTPGSASATGSASRVRCSTVSICASACRASPRPRSCSAPRASPPRPSPRGSWPPGGACSSARAPPTPTSPDRPCGRSRASRRRPSDWRASCWRACASAAAVSSASCASPAPSPTSLRATTRGTSATERWPRPLPTGGRERGAQLPGCACVAAATTFRLRPCIMRPGARQRGGRSADETPRAPART